MKSEKSKPKTYSELQKKLQKKTEKHPSNSKKYLLAFLRYLPLVWAVLFAGIAYVGLVVDQREFLLRAQELSLFLPGEQFLHLFLAQPGLLLDYAGAWCTQFFYYPWLGAGILVTLWLLLIATLQTAFRIRAKWGLWLLVAPVALLAIDTSVGYWIFHMKFQGYLFNATLGMLLAALSLCIYRYFPVRWRVCWIAFWVIAGYPLAGFYALLATGYMALMAIKEERSLIQRIGQPIVAFLFMALVPVFYYYIYTQTNYVFIYFAGLPTFMFPTRNFSLWLPYAVMCLSMLPLVLLSQSRALLNKEDDLSINSKMIHKLPVYLLIQVALLGSLGYLAISHWFNDTNFRYELKMNRLAWEKDWDQIIEEAHTWDQEPTRLMVLFKNLALFKEGRAGDEMFRFFDGGAKENSMIDERMTQIGGKYIYLNYAKFNFCYRWCLEDAVEYGNKVEYLKYMSLCALYSGELKLATKYLHTLEKTRFHADWAREQFRFVRNPALLKQDPNFQTIYPLYVYADRLDGDQNLVEIYLLKFFNSTWSKVPLYQEMSLMCNLVMKDIPNFWPRFFEYSKSHPRIPTHYQEAAILYAYLEKRDPSVLPIDEDVKSRFNEFQRTLSQNPGQTEEQLQPLFRSLFGDTFWYFYFFVRNVKSN
ncbi:MAG: DUF6057 family protein [Bacteroidaceae bacterium]